MRASRGMGGMKASKMPGKKTTKRKDNPNAVAVYAKGSRAKKPNKGKSTKRMAEGGSTKDECYSKVKARYKVFPSAYASGAIAKCRKVGAKNWGKGGKGGRS